MVNDIPLTAWNCCGMATNNEADPAGTPNASPNPPTIVLVVLALSSVWFGILLRMVADR